MASSALLAEIQKGKSLKKAQTNDRSGPAIESGSRKGGTGGVSLSNGSPSVAASTSPSAGGAPQLGALFAGGIPKLKPSGSTPQKPPANLAKPPTVAPKRDSAPPTAPPRPPPARPAAPPPPPPPTTAAPPAVPVRPPSRPAPARTPPPPTTTTAASPPSPAAPLLPPRHVPPPPPPTSSSSHTPPPPQPPRRPPPSAVNVTGNSPQPPSIPPRSQTQSTPPLSAVPASHSPILNGPSRTPPLPPVRTAPALPPAPIPRPSSAAPTNSALTRAVPPPPPARRPLEETIAPALPARTRAISSIERSSSSVISVPPRPSAPAPERQRAVSSGAPVLPPVRLASNIGTIVPVGGTPKSRRRYPTPPPTSGSLTFAIGDFPVPRAFSETQRIYPSGRVKGSGFNLEGL